MINIQYNMVLNVGSFNGGVQNDQFETFDTYTLMPDEDVYDILATHNKDKDCNYAELMFLGSINGTDAQITVMYLKKIKLKGKGYRWVID